jgi:polysaccharide deacetylase 2 family uncharacterized protein YibQ
MAADDLSTPLGQRRKRRRRRVHIPVPPIIAGALALFFGTFVVWAIVGDDPFGGEPIAVVPANVQVSAAGNSSEGKGPPAAGGPAGVTPNDGPTVARPAAQSAPQGTTTINIINGMTGARQEVTIPAPGQNLPPPASTPIDPQFAEMTPQGPIPKIAADGVRPADAYAQPVKAPQGMADAPRIAIIVSGLGISAKATSDATTELPGPVTLAFIPYGVNAAPVALARHQGHEVLLQVPMEPFDYPDNDPGPQTLLTSLAPAQNMERLYWLMSRFQGYVGLMNMMGARFTASEQSFSPVLREAGKRGLIFVDDGSNPRSVASRIAGANSLPFAKADVDIDAVPTPTEIDHALGRLEVAARERHVAVGVASALPVSIAHIAKWAKAAAKRGILLIPITAVALKDKQS